MRGDSDQGGFSLIEIVVVVAIVGVLVAISVASYAFTTARSQAVTCAANRRAFDTAATIYTADRKAPPDDIDELRRYVRNFERIVVCPADSGTLLQWDTGARATTCDIHRP